MYTVIRSFPYHDPPERPKQQASKGRGISLYANHFEVNFPKLSCAYHYDISIVPDKCPTSLNQEIIWQLQQQIKAECQIAFDGKKNGYTSKPIPAVFVKDKVCNN